MKSKGSGVREERHGGSASGHISQTRLEYGVMPTKISTWREGKVVGAWLAGGVGLICLGSWLSSEEAIIIWIAWLVGLVILLGRLGGRMAGPLFFYDVVRTARHNRLIPLRCLYAGFLTVALFGVYTSWFGWPREDWREVFDQPSIKRARLPEFAQSFSNVFMMGQLAVVALVTPLLTAGAVAEERERRTLNLLLTTALSDREIIFGLFASRMATLGLVVLTGLPILLVMPFLGGVEPIWVVTIFVTTSMTMFTLGALSILISVTAQSSLGAFLGSYALSVFLSPLGIGLAYLAVIFGQEELAPVIGMLLATTFFQGVLIVVFLQAATSQLRTTPGEWPGDLAGVSRPQSISQYRGESIQFQPPAHREVIYSEFLGETSRPPVTDPPVLWKDYYRKNLGGAMTACSLAAMVMIGLFSLGSLSKSTAVTDVVGYWAAIVAAIILLPVPVLAAQMIGQERASGTLDCLLATPLPTQEIFTNKWQASVMGTRWSFAILAGLMLLAAIGMIIHPLAFVILVVAWFVYAALLSCLGLFWSMFIRSTRMATLSSVLTVLALGVGSEYEAPVPAGNIHSFKDWVLCVSKEMVSPLSTLRILAFGWERTPTNLREIQVAILAVLFTGLLALGLWKLMLFEFRRTTRKG